MLSGVHKALLDAQRNVLDAFGLPMAFDTRSARRLTSVPSTYNPPSGSARGRTRAMFGGGSGAANPFGGAPAGAAPSGQQGWQGEHPASLAEALSSICEVVGAVRS